MKRLIVLTICLVLLTACGASPESLATQTARADTAIAALWTKTPTITLTLTSSPTNTPTLTPIPSPTSLPTATMPVPLTKDEVVNLEKTLIEMINSSGVGDRFVINDPTLAGENRDLSMGGLVFSEGSAGSTQISTEFPGDVFPIPDVYGQNVWRFRGTVSLDLQKTTGEVYSYKFIGEGDDLNLLTFGRFKSLGFVYLRGKGRVILLNGDEVKLGY